MSLTCGMAAITLVATGAGIACLVLALPFHRFRRGKAAEPEITSLGEIPRTTVVHDFTGRLN